MSANDILMRGAFKMLKNVISPEQIKEAATGLIQKAIDYKSKIVLNADAHEAETVAMFYEVKGKVYFTVAILDKDNKITRFENTSLLENLLDQLIKQM
jgi:hypothetical protein